jgi:hypothetical protein
MGTVFLQVTEMMTQDVFTLSFFLSFFSLFHYDDDRGLAGAPASALFSQIVGAIVQLPDESQSLESSSRGYARLRIRRT